jgi:isocitrate dehydrogenase
VYAKIAGRPEQAEVEAAINQAIENGPALAMVNSDKGITTFMSLLVIVRRFNASDDSYIRTNVEQGRKITRYLAVIPDRSYAGIYTATIDFVKEWCL